MKKNWALLVGVTKGQIGKKLPVYENPPQYTKIIIMPQNVFLHGEIKNNEPNIRLKYVVNQVI